MACMFRDSGINTGLLDGWDMSLVRDGGF
jgi:hypothetical protein